MFNAIDPILTAVVIIIMLRGFRRRWYFLRGGQGEQRSKDWFGLFRYLFGHRKILERPVVGAAHIAVFWGVILPLLVAILAQFPVKMPGALARALSLLLDLLGLMTLLACLVLLVRRISLNKDALEPKGAIAALGILIIICFSGFFAEALRLRITQPELFWPWPVGWIIAGFLPSSPLLMQIMIRIHIASVLLFIALLPFTFMRHVIAGTMNIVLRERRPHGVVRPISLDNGPLGAGIVWDFSWKQLLDAEACVCCSRCEQRCPAFVSGKPLSPKKVMTDILAQMDEIRKKDLTSSNPLFPNLKDALSPDELWACTTCMACTTACPLFIDPLDKIMAVRRHEVLACGALPGEAETMIRNLEIFGDPEGRGKSRRKQWAWAMDIPHIDKVKDEARILLWVGCSGAFHPRYKEVLRSMVKILREGQVQFGTLGNEELCCGDVARRLGREDVFIDLARKNLRSFEKYKVKTLVTLCPHGFNTFKNEYKELGANFEVFHAVEYVVKLIKENRISPRYSLSKLVTIHDPCYLARGNGIHSELRQILHQVPGIKLEELQDSDQQTFCCGGGGGRMWLRERLGTKINTLRAQEIKDTGVNMVATACPFCLTMIEDGLRSASSEGEPSPRVADVIEILSSSLGLD